MFSSWEQPKTLGVKVGARLPTSLLLPLSYFRGVCGSQWPVSIHISAWLLALVLLAEQIKHFCFHSESFPFCLFALLSLCTLMINPIWFRLTAYALCCQHYIHLHKWLRVNILRSFPEMVCPNKWCYLLPGVCYFLRELKPGVTPFCLFIIEESMTLMLIFCNQHSLRCNWQITKFPCEMYKLVALYTFLFWNNHRYTKICKDSTEHPIYPSPVCPQLLLLKKWLYNTKAGKWY